MKYEYCIPQAQWFYCIICTVQWFLGIRMSHHNRTDYILLCCLFHGGRHADGSFSPHPGAVSDSFSLRSQRPMLMLPTETPPVLCTTQMAHTFLKVCPMIKGVRVMSKSWLCQWPILCLWTKSFKILSLHSHICEIKILISNSYLEGDKVR